MPARRRQKPSRHLDRRLARSVQPSIDMTRSMLLLCLPLLAANVARADDRVLLQEVMPELAGTALGALDIAPAPPLGATLVVRRAEVQRALSKAGLSSKDLSIPHSMRV